jgi:hypothetical protein
MKIIINSKFTEEIHEETLEEGRIAVLCKQNADNPSAFFEFLVSL